MTIKPLMYT